jgi:hypothetical protein
LSGKGRSQESLDIQGFQVVADTLDIPVLGTQVTRDEVGFRGIRVSVEFLDDQGFRGFQGIQHVLDTVVSLDLELLDSADTLGKAGFQENRDSVDFLDTPPLVRVLPATVDFRVTAGFRDTLERVDIQGIPVLIPEHQDIRVSVEPEPVDILGIQLLVRDRLDTLDIAQPHQARLGFPAIVDSRARVATADFVD